MGRCSHLARVMGLTCGALFTPGWGGGSYLWGAVHTWGWVGSTCRTLFSSGELGITCGALWVAGCVLPVGTQVPSHIDTP